MKRQTRTALGLIGFAAAASLYPCFAEAQIATPAVAAIPGAAQEVPFELFRDSRIFLEGRINGNETPMAAEDIARVTQIGQSRFRSTTARQNSPQTSGKNTRNA